eukprot:UN05295
MSYAPAFCGGGVLGVTLFNELTYFAQSSKLVYKTINVAKNNAIATAIVTGIEISVLSCRYLAGSLSGPEFCRLTGKAIVRNIAVGSALYASAKLGAAVGTAIAPGVGTGVGIVCGLIFGFLAGKGAEYLYEKVFPNDEELAKREMLNEALKYFQFKEKDIKDDKKFNKKELKRRFKGFALLHHPDRNNGDATEWLKLSEYYEYYQG